jgi:anti-sigma-K factor RskA
MTLDEQLQALEEAEGRAAPPPHVEAMVMNAFDAHPPVEGRTNSSRLGRRWPAIASLAAGVVLGVALTAWHVGRSEEAPMLAAVPVSESVVLVLEPPGVEETVRVVRIRVARSALEGLGIQTVASQESESVEIDVLVGEDGVARGVRLAM